MRAGNSVSALRECGHQPPSTAPRRLSAGSKLTRGDGGPVGLNSLAVAIGEEAGTLEEVNEPYLIMEGYIKRTPQGRVATANAYKKLGLKPPAGTQGELL